MPVIPKHLIRRGTGATNPSGNLVEEGHGVGASCGTTKHCTPTTHQRGVDPPFQDGRAPDLVIGKSQKLSCLRVLARSNAVPLTVAHRGRAVPFRERGLTKWCPQPTALHNSEPSRVEVVDGVEVQISDQHNTFVGTRPLNSRQIRALLPKTPATGHADRWWPKLSRRRPHQHECAVKGRGI